MSAEVDKIMCRENGYLGVRLSNPNSNLASAVGVRLIATTSALNAQPRPNFRGERARQGVITAAKAHEGWPLARACTDFAARIIPRITLPAGFFRAMQLRKAARRL